MDAVTLSPPSPPLPACCRCPNPQCGAPLSPAVLQRVLSPSDFERWEQLTLQRTLDTMPGELALPEWNMPCCSHSQVAACLPWLQGQHSLCQLHRVLTCLLSHLPLRPADAAYCPRCSTLSLEDEDSCAQVSASGRGGELEPCAAQSLSLR